MTKVNRLLYGLRAGLPYMPHKFCYRSDDEG